MSRSVFLYHVPSKFNKNEKVWQKDMLVEMLLPKPFLALMMRFLRRHDTEEDVRQKVFMVTILFHTIIAEIFTVMFMVHRSGFSGTSEGWLLDPVTQPRSMCLAFCLCQGAMLCILVGSLIHLYNRGVTTRMKILLLSGSLLCYLATSVICGKMPMYWIIIICLDVSLIVQSRDDKVLLDRLSLVFQVVVILFSVVDAVEEVAVASTGEGFGLHPWREEENFSWPVAAPLSAFVTILNFQLIRGFSESVWFEQRRLKASVDLSFDIAERLADYDLDAAERLLATTTETPVTQELARLCRNLRAYRGFLPHTLFAKEHVASPSDALAEKMKDKNTSWDHVNTAVSRMLDPEYTLRDFHNHMLAAFPELALYKSDKTSSGLSGADEYERTLGALYSVYCLLRLDIDGKEIFSFGVNERWLPEPLPVGEHAAKKLAFYQNMPWDRISELMSGARVMRDRSVRPSRAVALLTLTAIHDIMKNTDILPAVQPEHAPFEGHAVGETINDHDLALAYVLEHFPAILPSYRDLAPGQRAPILFTQGKMGFNNGWLVQGEAPPGALFHKFKRAIVQGGASQADISFYFAHWFTDLAGAEPFGGKPWPGAEKFSVKFPWKVLAAFLDSFGFVKKLAMMSEVEVMEEYLVSRVASLWPMSPIPPGDGELAAMRFSLMAQGFELEIVSAFQRLPREDHQVLSDEMASSGCKEQFVRSPEKFRKSRAVGPALLIYYAPAFIQKATSQYCFEALRVLASICRAARKLFPVTEEGSASWVTIRIDELKVLTPHEIEAGMHWHLRRTSSVDAEVVRGPNQLKGLSVSLTLPTTDPLPCVKQSF